MRLLTFTDVARLLGVSLPTARKFRDELPGAVRVSQRVRYREEAIEDFVRRGGFLADKPATDSVTASQAL
jgi:hypothetical protein